VRAAIFLIVSYLHTVLTNVTYSLHVYVIVFANYSTLFVPLISVDCHLCELLSHVTQLALSDSQVDTPNHKLSSLDHAINIILSSEFCTKR
jgi:hypothetical protein